MPYIEPSVIEQAKRIDLLTYLEQCEPSELVKISRTMYCTKDNARMHFLLREDLIKLDKITRETQLLGWENIQTAEQLFTYRQNEKAKNGWWKHCPFCHWEVLDSKYYSLPQKLTSKINVLER